MTLRFHHVDLPDADAAISVSSTSGPGPAPCGAHRRQIRRLAAFAGVAIVVVMEGRVSVMLRTGPMKYAGERLQSSSSGTFATAGRAIDRRSGRNCRRLLDERYRTRNSERRDMTTTPAGARRSRTIAAVAAVSGRDAAEKNTGMSTDVPAAAFAGVGDATPWTSAPSHQLRYRALDGRFTGGRLQRQARCERRRLRGCGSRRRHGAQQPCRVLEGRQFDRPVIARRRVRARTTLACVPARPRVVIGRHASGHSERARILVDAEPRHHASVSA